ncbi:hypothetical protein BXT86_03875 [candidate division WOR-3 bacterium 4484_100]|uniref:4Fe-4S ferredoxin-type domain-containing protein n=1 Tax=candidate division WOR-3 bacterium 4484_100 TaxID=1936077 RepID=A0A1V4QFB5_UNCW3|nr:MAG: hypothetical protein BXT86_03875 [candidate division WOR-3 bacterium 4484_100]
MAKVYFLDMRKRYKKNILEKFIDLLKTSRALDIVKKNDLCAVKLHIGEQGNVNFVGPQYVRLITQLIEDRGANTFLTDTTTLYAGRRYRGDLHIELAREHGFDFSPFIVADGLYGDDYVEVDDCKIARLFTQIDRLFVVSHFKGHLNCGFGGTIKNLGMGCASKGGKLAMHSRSKPTIDINTCNMCLRCFDYCLYQAIKKKKDHLEIDHGLCTGCGGCMSICPDRAIKFSWDAASEDIQKEIARYASAVIKNKKAFYINFLINISPNCDCFHSNEPMIAPDIGILGSFDPVALDQACYDFIKEPIDKLHPELDPQVQLHYAEKFGAGERKYEIKVI